MREAPNRARENVLGWWGRSRTFIAQVGSELQRVTWPSRKEVYATTLVVILTSLFFGTFLWGLDAILAALANLVFRTFAVA